MKFTDYLILAAVLVWAAFSLYFIVRAKRRGQSLCCGQNCSACGGCAHCEHLRRAEPKQPRA